jgi:alkylation response protein AidB-like acyl-CoA dehydrogenase
MYPHYEQEQTEMAEAVMRGLQHLGPCDPQAAWTQITEVGLPLLAVPADHGGLGSDSRTFHAVAEALGRSLQPSAFATSSLAATRLVDTLAQGPQRSSLLNALADGSLVLGLALSEPQAHFDIESVATRAESTSAGWRVSGRKVVALHSGPVRQWIVSARTTADDMLLLLVAEGTTGLTVRRYECLDGSQACDLELKDVEIDSAHQLGQPGQASAQALAAATDLAELALCAESVGIQARLLQDTVSYAKERRQFGAAIGSFQAVQHRLVDMLVALEQARSLAWLLATEFERVSPQRRAYLASAAKARCIASGRLIGLQSIHLHGGMGMTDELPVGHGVKRLLAIENSFGDESHHLARIVAASASSSPSTS